MPMSKGHGAQSIRRQVIDTGIARGGAVTSVSGGSLLETRQDPARRSSNDIVFVHELVLRAREVTGGVAIALAV